MAEAKYYQPEIEEFHVGFELELKLHELKNWENHTWLPGDQASSVAKYLDQIRVKCLDRDDIESFGFVWGGSWGCYNKQMWKGKGLTCCLYFSHDMVSINIGVIGDLLKDMPQYFRGKIKNKSELKRLLKQLEII